MNVPFLDLKKQYEDIREEVETNVLEILDSCCYIGGEYVNQFETEMEDYLGVKHVLGCSNGTDALVLGLKACNINPGDEVITTPFTFFATAEAIASVGAIPVFVDIRSDDYNIDFNLIEAAISDKTKAIMPVHIFGAPCDMDSINDIAKRYSLKVIEDDAQAIGSEYKGNKAGTLGDVGCFSFYPTKNLGGAGDGGMVTTNNDDIFIALKAFKEHGAGENGATTYSLQTGRKAFVESDEQKTELYDPYKYYNYLIGYNSRLDAIQATVLSCKLKRLNNYNAKRASIARRYYDELTNKVKLPRYSDDIVPCYHQFVICTKYKYELCKYMSDNGVGNGTFYPIPLHRQKAFDKNNSRISGGDSLPIAENIASQSVCLPIFPEMSDGQVDYVIDVVNKFFEDK